MYSVICTYYIVVPSDLQQLKSMRKRSILFPALVSCGLFDKQKYTNTKASTTKKYRHCERDLCIQEIGLCCDEYHCTNDFRFVTFVVEYMVNRTHHYHRFSIQYEKILILNERDIKKK